MFQTGLVCSYTHTSGEGWEQAFSLDSFTRGWAGARLNSSVACRRSGVGTGSCCSLNYCIILSQLSDKVEAMAHQRVTVKRLAAKMQSLEKMVDELSIKRDAGAG